MRAVKAGRVDGEARWRRVLPRVLVVSAALVLLGELGARTFLTSPSGQAFDEDLGWTWRPGAIVFNGAEGGARLRINTLGWNDDEVGPKGGRRRAVVLGNSFTEALQVPRSENFTSVLERLVPGLDVVNLGRSAMGPAHYPGVLRRVAEALDPDLVVVVVGEGDLPHLLGPLTVVEEAPGGGIARIAVAPEGKDRVKAAFGPVLERSALATWLMRRYKPVVLGWLDAFGVTGDAVAAEPGEAAPGAGPDGGGADDREEAVRRLAFLLSEMTRSFPVVVVDVPEIRYGGDRRATRLDPAASEVYRRAAAIAGAELVDAGDELVRAWRETGRPGHGFDNLRLGIGHLNRDGHEAVGRALARSLGAPHALGAR